MFNVTIRVIFQLIPLSIKMFLIYEETIFIDNSNSGSPSARSREKENVNLALKLFSKKENKECRLFVQTIIFIRIELYYIWPCH